MTLCLHVVFSSEFVFLEFSFLSYFLINYFQTWRQYQQRDPWPGMRYCHIAASLKHGRQPQRLLNSGGAGAGETYDDMWFMDPHSGRMEKVRNNL